MALDTSAKNKDSLRRVLLAEVLIEEYKTLEQPELDQAELETIEKEIEEFHRDSPSMSDTERTEAEKKLNGELVKKIYALMTDAQRRATDAQAEKDANDYRQLYSTSYKSLGAEEIDRVVNRAVIAKMYGHVDELIDKHERKYIDETDTA